MSAPPGGAPGASAYDRARPAPPHPGEPGVPVHHLVRRLVRRRLTWCLATVRK
ncbi:hypothetical protein [Streptomyces roseoviridis]|uniref:Uncharacterized protein n=1 Tax=Streptomyces roseoviridis TaxID=67361 RepID=A0ABV5QH00_9ACTN